MENAPKQLWGKGMLTKLASEVFSNFARRVHFRAMLLAFGNLWQAKAVSKIAPRQQGELGTRQHDHKPKDDDCSHDTRLRC